MGDQAMKNTTRQLRDTIKGLLAKQRLTVLATQGDIYPYNTLVGYAFTKDLKVIIFSTMKDTRKYRNLVSNPFVSLLVDSRRNDIGDFKDALALTVIGKAKKVRASLKAKYRRLYLEKFPYLKEFIRDPDNRLIALQVERYILVRRFQEVLELQISKPSKRRGL